MRTCGACSTHSATCCAGVRPLRNLLFPVEGRLAPDGPISWAVVRSPTGDMSATSTSHMVLTAVIAGAGAQNVRITQSRHRQQNGQRVCVCGSDLLPRAPARMQWLEFPTIANLQAGQPAGSKQRGDASQSSPTEQYD